MSDALDYTKDWTDEKFFEEAGRLSREWEESAACYSYDSMLVEVGEHRGIYVPYLMQEALRIKEAGECQNPRERCCCRRHMGNSAEANAAQEQMRVIIEGVYRKGMARGYRIAEGLRVEGDRFTGVRSLAMTRCSACGDRDPSFASVCPATNGRHAT